MPKEEDLGSSGAAGQTQGPYELKPEHMKKSDGVVPSKSVPPPDDELLRPLKPKEQEP